MGTKQVFTKTLKFGHHVRAFAVFALPDGWVAFEEGDRRVLRTRLDDWHKVERTLSRFKNTIDGLLSAGWQDARA
jgi:cupin superfamily acireductone dioxygenase involved in methionine salvage